MSAIRGVIGPLDGGGFNQIVVEPVALVRDACAPLAVDRLDPHQIHEDAHMTVGGFDALALEHAGGPPCPEEGMFQVWLVDGTRESKIVVRDRLRVVRYGLARHRLSSSHWRVTVSSLSRSISVLRSASSSAGVPLSNASPACSNSCLRRAVIWEACTPWRYASAASIASPHIAMSATISWPLLRSIGSCGDTMRQSVQLCRPGFVCEKAGASLHSAQLRPLTSPASLLGVQWKGYG